MALHRWILQLYVAVLWFGLWWLLTDCCRGIVATSTTATTRLPDGSQLAAFGIDLGAENVRFAASQALWGVQVLTNEQSKRETPAVIAFVPITEKILERRFGETGIAPAYGRYSEYAVRSVRKLLEQTDCSSGETLQTLSKKREKRLVHDCALQLGGRRDLAFTDIELVGMFLGHVRRRAYEAMRTLSTSALEVQSSSSIPAEQLYGSDAVLTVPVWFRQSQRAALIKAARLAGWNIRGLVHTPLAAAIRFALDREISGNQTVLFVDVGAQGTTAALIRLTASKGPKTAGVATGDNTQPVQDIEVLAYEWDHEAGGHAFDRCLSELALTRLGADLLRSSSVSVDAERRFQLRLEREAKRVKEVLSANPEALFHIELPNGDERQLLITRTAFEDRCSNLFERIEGCLRRLLSKHAGDPNDTVLDALIPLGGSSRIPRVEQVIQRVAGSHRWQKTVNAEEAAVMGAAFYAAALSPFFRVRPIRLQDQYPHAFRVCVTRESSKEFAAGDCKVFYPQVAHLGSTQHFLVSQANIPLQLHLYEVGGVAGVEDNATRIAHWRFNGWPTEPKEAAVFEVSFTLNAFGAPELTSAQLHWNDTAQVDLPTLTTGTMRHQEGSRVAQNDSIIGHKRAPQTQSVETNATTTTASIKETSTMNGTAAWTSQTKAKVLDPLPKFSLWDLHEASMRTSSLYLATLDAQDLKRERRAHLLNALEAKLLRAHEDFGTPGAALVSGSLVQRICRESERDKILKQARRLELWLHQRPSTELDIAELEQRLQELELVTRPIYERIEIYHKRLEALQQLVRWIQQHYQQDGGQGSSHESLQLHELLEQVQQLAERLRAHPSVELITESEQEMQLLSERFLSVLFSLNQTHTDAPAKKADQISGTVKTNAVPTSASITTKPKEQIDHTEL
jgi:molecular chaperone DnaK (HSP70)